MKDKVVVSKYRTLLHKTNAYSNSSNSNLDNIKKLSDNILIIMFLLEKVAFSSTGDDSVNFSA